MKQFADQSPSLKPFISGTLDDLDRDGIIGGVTPRGDDHAEIAPIMRPRRSPQCT